VKLYSLNTPCWSDYDSKNTAGSELIKDPLSDHFTFMFYNFMKFGLVDDVTIFLEEKRIKRGITSKVFETEYGKMKIEPSSNISNMQLEENQFVYAWSKWEECESLKNNFVIVNPMFSGRNYPKCFKKGVHNYALIEGEPFSDTVPDWMPYSVFRYTTQDFCDITDDTRSKSTKIYDWVMVSSFDPRKRHIQFLNEMVKKAQTKKMRGCIIGRNPDNKGYRNSTHEVLESVKSIIKHYNLDVDIFLNVGQDLKKDLMLSSRCFVCASALDNGPRAMVEATQAGLPLISMPHIGSSDLIIPEVTGEIVTDFQEFPTVVEKVIKNEEQYDKHKNAKMLMPKNVYPNLIKNLRERKDG
tara:strand:- start:149 stop:1213 length:1065 start_codon:yes stop_codon:yes gene_type:complete